MANIFVNAVRTMYKVNRFRNKYKFIMLIQFKSVKHFRRIKHINRQINSGLDSASGNKTAKTFFVYVQRFIHPLCYVGQQFPPFYCCLFTLAKNCVHCAHMIS